MKSNNCHLESVTTPRVVWASKTRNHSVNVTTSVVWVSEIMNTHNPLRKKNSLRNLSIYQTRQLTLPQQRRQQRKKNSLRNLSINQTRQWTLPQQRRQHHRHHQADHRVETGREDLSPQRNPGINWTEEPSQSSCYNTQPISQHTTNLCLNFRLESRVSSHISHPAWRVTLWPGLQMQVGSMSHERSPENKKRRRCVHEIKTTNQQVIKGSGVFQLLLSRRKEKSAGWLAVRTSETLRGITVTRLPETPAWISIRQSIFKTGLFQAETNGYNQAWYEHTLMTITSTSPALRSHALDSSEARSSMYPLCHCGSSSTWTTTGPARGWRSSSSASAAAISSSPGSSLPPATWGSATPPTSATSRSNSSGMCSAPPAINVKKAIWNMMAASMASSPSCPAASAPRTGGRATLCLLEESSSATLSSSTIHSSIQALSDITGEEADGPTEEPELPSARGSPEADSPLPRPPSEELGLSPNRGVVSTISPVSAGLLEADEEGDGVQVPDRRRRGGQVAAAPEQRSRSTRWHPPHLSHPRNSNPLSRSLKSWLLKSPSIPAERQDPRLKLHSSVASLLLSARVQHDNLETVFPILRSQLLRCRHENVPRAGEEELKYSNASFIKPKHTKEAASKPPRVHTHNPRCVVVTCCKESFYQPERKDERDKMPRSKLPHNGTLPGRGQPRRMPTPAYRPR